MTNLQKVTKRALYVPALLFLGACCASKPVSKVSPASANQSSQAASAAASASASAASAAAASAAMNAVSLGDIYFDFDRANITPESEAQLKQNADWMAVNKTKSVIIEGHCDERGTAEYNMALGERRAESAKSGMKSLGVDPARVSTVSFGEEKPFDPGHNEEAWAKNRRDHFIAK
ncbi:MAG: peptidoglycan-associated lipoprotein Pal [Chlorobaculum sp.]|nr:peptidoglycan-associated lipoprotein Pal [Chlorobaculum sp.]